MLHRRTRRTRGRAIVAASFILSVISSQALAQTGGGNGGGGGGAGGGNGGGGEAFSNTIPSTRNSFPDYFVVETPRPIEPCRKLKRYDKCR